MLKVFNKYCEECKLISCVNGTICEKSLIYFNLWKGRDITAECNDDDNVIYYEFYSCEEFDEFLATLAEEEWEELEVEQGDQSNVLL